MGKKLRQGDPWMPSFQYGALLPSLSLNLLVENVERSVLFYQKVFEAEAHYFDIDFGAIRVGPVEVMLHADHTHDNHPWYSQLSQGAMRGLGAQIRILGIDPDKLEKRARDYGAPVPIATEDKVYGWREVLVRDPDGYEWGVGILIDPAKGPARPTPSADS